MRTHLVMLSVSAQVQVALDEQLRPGERDNEGP